MKRYNDFLNENSDNEYKTLKQGLIEIVSIFNGSFRNTHFLKNGQKEFEEFLKECKQNNFDVNYFMSTYISKAIQDNDLIYRSAIMDMLLYKYDKTHPLSGSLLIDDIDNWDEHGAIIKYNYNYHKLDLGKKYLYQSYDNLFKFYEETAKEFPLIFIQNGINYKIKQETKKIYLDLEYYSDIINCKNYYASIIDLKSLCENNYIHCSYDELLNNIEYANMKILPFYSNSTTTNTYHHIIEGCFIAYFGENIKRLEVCDIDDAIERMEIKRSVEKYNL